MVKTLKMRDKSDKYTIIKKDIPSLPMRLLAIGRTGCGKSSVALGNLLLRPEFYKNDFLPENIFIFSGSLKGDLKLQTIIEILDVPPSNLFNTFDEEEAHIIYDMLVDNFNQSHKDKKKVHHSLFIFDDLGFTNLQNKNNKNSIMDKLMSNGRKYLISIITLNQRITQLSSNTREQASALMLWKSTNRQLELVEQYFNYMTGKNAKRKFFDMIKNHTENMHDFLVFDLGKKDIYRDSEFKPILIDNN